MVLILELDRKIVLICCRDHRKNINSLAYLHMLLSTTKLNSYPKVSRTHGSGGGDSTFVVDYDMRVRK